MIKVIAETSINYPFNVNVKLKKFELNRIPNKIFIKCPSCGFIPQNSNLFLSLPLSNYNMQHKKLVIIKCQKDICSFEGNIIDWLQFD